ncbi:hypothetical protein D3C77_803020 [compost metagenome]
MLNLERSTRKLLTLQKALCSDAAGQEVFVGLSRLESERYIELWSEATDDFIELDRKHKRALHNLDNI